jgi:excisionase family DNA binding protein
MPHSSDRVINSGRISVAEIAKRLSIGRLGVYTMLVKKIIPAIRFGRRWIITRRSYEQWEQAAGRMETDGTLNRA